MLNSPPPTGRYPVPMASKPGFPTSTSRWALATLVAVSAAGSVVACATAPEPEPASAFKEMSPAEIVRARQAALHMSGATMGAIRGNVVQGDGDPKAWAYAARGVARWARVLPTMFPESTAAITPSRARPVIWQNKTDFNAKAAAYAAAAEQMAAVAETGSKEEFVQAWRATAATCTACHDVYQAPPPNN